MSKFKLPLAYVIVIVVLSVSIGYYSEKLMGRSVKTEIDADLISTPSNYHIIRKPGFKYTRPLLFAKESDESSSLSGIKSELNQQIEAMKSSGQITGASVYLRLLDKSEWTLIGDNDKYLPGSLMKVPELIAFMKMNMLSPGLLNKKITYASPFKMPKQTIYKSKSIELGKTYSIRELLHYMISYSDNYATALLNQHMDMNIFRKIFTDLGMPDPDLTKNDLPISAKDFSLFMRVLYNGSYLSNDDSEFCTALLSTSDFKDGILNGLPENMKVVHKFGEAADQHFAYLNESAIVYLNNNPYLITVMVKNKTSSTLPKAISEISRSIFTNIQRMS